MSAGGEGPPTPPSSHCPPATGGEGDGGIDRTKEGPNLPSAHVFSSTVAMLDTGSREDAGRGHGHGSAASEPPVVS